MAEYDDWMNKLRQLFKSRPKKPKAASASAPGFGPARSIGPAAPVLTAAEAAAKGAPAPAARKLIPLAEMLAEKPANRKRRQ